MNWASLKLLVLDVDGVLTDGRIHSSTDGAWEKAFYVQDGCAVKMWARAGGTSAIVTGRSDAAIHRRAEELGIEHLRTGAGEKVAALHDILLATETTADAVVYVGDDLPDLGPMKVAAFPVAVANAHPAVKRAAGYVTRRLGGAGAVAEVVEFLLRKQGRWAGALARESGVT